MSNIICVTDLFDKSPKLLSKDFIRTVLPHKEEGTEYAYRSVITLKDNSYHFVQENVSSINDLLRA